MHGYGEQRHSNETGEDLDHTTNVCDDSHLGSLPSILRTTSQLGGRAWTTNATTFCKVANDGNKPLALSSVTAFSMR